MVVAEFNHQTGILESKFKGKVKLQEVVDYIRATKGDSAYPRFLKILTDSKDATFDFSPSDLETIIAENNQSLEKYDHIVDAIVVNSPQTTAISMLYMELGRNKKYHFNIFSTQKAALAWLARY